jgi:hypothetical protein
VVVKNGLGSWKAMNWTMDYLRSKLGNEVVKVEHSKDNVFRYTDEEFNDWITFSEFITRLEKNETDKHYYVTGVDNVKPIHGDLK